MFALDVNEQDAGNNDTHNYIIDTLVPKDGCLNKERAEKKDTVSHN